MNCQMPEAPTTSARAGLNDDSTCGSAPSSVGQPAVGEDVCGCAHPSAPGAIEARAELVRLAELEAHVRRRRCRSVRAAETPAGNRPSTRCSSALKPLRLPLRERSAARAVRGACARSRAALPARSQRPFGSARPRRRGRGRRGSWSRPPSVSTSAVDALPELDARHERARLREVGRGASLSERLVGAVDGRSSRRAPVGEGRARLRRRPLHAGRPRRDRERRRTSLGGSAVAAAGTRAAPPTPSPSASATMRRHRDGLPTVHASAHPSGGSSSG